MTNNSLLIFSLRYAFADEGFFIWFNHVLRLRSELNELLFDYAQDKKKTGARELAPGKV